MMMLLTLILGSTFIERYTGSSVWIVFKDSEGNPVGGVGAFVDKVSANSSAPFEILVYADFNSQDYEVYANQW